MAYPRDRPKPRRGPCFALLLAAAVAASCSGPAALAPDAQPHTRPAAPASATSLPAPGYAVFSTSDVWRPPFDRPVQSIPADRPRTATAIGGEELRQLSFVLAGSDLPRAAILTEGRYSPADLRPELSEDVLLWRNLLHALGTASALIEPQFLSRELRQFQILVVPDGYRLDTGQLGAIYSFVKDGGLLIYTGVLASPNPFVNQTRHWSFERAMGLYYSASYPLDPGEAEARPDGIILDANTPLTAGVEPTYVLQVKAPAHALTVNWGDQPYLAPGSWHLPGATGAQRRERWIDRPAIVAGDVGDGRFVWLGTRISDVQSGIANQETWRALVRNALRWGRHLPVASPRWWPGSYRAAAMLAFDLRRNSAPMTRALELLRRSGSPAATFFVTPPLEPTQEESAALEALARYGEIALAGASPIASLRYDEQLGRLQEGLRTFSRHFVPASAAAVPAIRGFRPASLGYDDRTLFALHRLGFEYMVPFEPAESSMPRWRGIGPGQGIVLLSPFAPADYSWAQAVREMTPAQLFEEHCREFDQIQRRGGFFLMLLSEQDLLAPNTSEAFLQMSSYLQGRRQVWLATGSEIGEWIRRRATIKTDVLDHSGGAMELIVHNLGSEPLEPFDVEVYAAAPSLAWQGVTTAAAREMLAAQLEPGGRVLVVRVDGLGPFEERSLVLQPSARSPRDLRYPLPDGGIPLVAARDEPWPPSARYGAAAGLPAEGFAATPSLAELLRRQPEQASEQLPRLGLPSPRPPAIPFTPPAPAPAPRISPTPTPRAEAAPARSAAGVAPELPLLVRPTVAPPAPAVTEQTLEEPTAAPPSPQPAPTTPTPFEELPPSVRPAYRPPRSGPPALPSDAPPRGAATPALTPAPGRGPDLPPDELFPAPFPRPPAPSSPRHAAGTPPPSSVAGGSPLPPFRPPSDLLSPIPAFPQLPEAPLAPETESLGPRREPARPRPAPPQPAPRRGGPTALPGLAPSNLDRSLDSFLYDVLPPAGGDNPLLPGAEPSPPAPEGTADSSSSDEVE